LGALPGMAVLLGMAMAGGAAAQVALPPGTPQPPPTGSPIPRVAPVPPPNVAPGLTSPATEPLQNLAPSTARRVTSVVVDGSTILDQSEVNAIVAGTVGPAVPTSTIEEARLNLLRRYRDNGYPLVTVAASLAADGRLRYTITEGRIAEVKLDGDIGPAGSRVLDFLGNLVQPGPVKAAALERWLLLAQDVPGVSMQTVLRPSESEPGALVLVARVTRSWYSGYLAVDNRAYHYTGPIQALGVIGANSFTSLGERTEISLFKSVFDNTQIFGQAAFETFLGHKGIKIRLYGGAGDTQPSGQLHQFGYDARTVVAGAQISYPVIYTRRQKLTVLGNFDLIQSDVFTSTGGTTAPTSKDQLRVVRVGLDYALQDIWLGAARPSVNQAQLRVSRGIDGLGSSHTGSLSLGRQDSNVEFTKISAELSRNQTLFSPWQDASVSVLLLAAGQFSNDIVPSAEKFYLGGQRYTRGFYAGEVTGDKALAATVELQLNTGYQTSLFGTAWDIGLQFYGFYDWGESWENKKLDQNHTLRSFGLGLRTALTRNIEVDIEGVNRLTRQTQSSGGLVKPLGEKALYMRLLARF
jgi:hemolysin activation/secretion protein